MSLCRNVKTVVCYVVENVEVAGSGRPSYRDEVLKKHFMTAAAAADIDGSIKRKRIRVSLNSMS